ncbi:MAG TPA: hypothetical protein VF585_04260 [Chthoniobacterales bacterium]
MKPRLSLFTFVACFGLFSAADAISPQKRGNAQTEVAETEPALPASQEATEESVLPDEPLLSVPEPEPAPDMSGLSVQPIPTEEISQPTGPTSDEKRRQDEAFRAAKTQAQEDFTLADIRLRAFASRTERQKRALLREYYQAISAYIVQRSPDLKEKAEEWAFLHQNRLGRARTEPDYQPPARPASLMKVEAESEEAADQAEKKKRTGPLPVLN